MIVPTFKVHASRSLTLLARSWLCLCLAWSTTTAAQEAATHRHDAAAVPASSTSVSLPLDAALIATLPRESVNATAHGRQLDCDGVSLAALLRAAGAMPDVPLRGTQLARVIVITARDGYHVVFALAELDAGLGDKRVLLTNRCNGATLAADDGPWRLVVPGESRPARWVRQIESIRVVDAH